MKLGLLYLVACASALAACTSSADRACTVGAECASGVCRGDGTCGPVAGGGGILDASSQDGGGGGTDGGAGGDGSSSTDAPAQGDGAAGACLPNHDGTIVREEIPLGPGLHAKYKVAQSAPVSTGGTAQADGSRVWDLTGAIAGDHDLLVETIAPTGQWFAADFPLASYTARLTDSSNLLGVFQTTASAVLLLGAVSPSGGSTATELPNSAGVPSLAFPMKMGSSWSGNVTVNGKLDGVPTLYSDAYESSVDAHGLMKTPYADFQVLRINTKLTRSVGGVTSLILRTFSFVAECAGPVATMLSQNNETAVEFTTAAEVQRLAP
jgi:hypothetical protein